MGSILRDMSYEFSETAVKHEVFKIGKPEGNLFEIEFTLTFSYGFLEYAHDFVWLNEDVEVLLKQIKEMDGKESGTFSVLSPGVSFSYSKYTHEEGIYFFTVAMDTGYINAYMGTESNLGITIKTTLTAISTWVKSFLQ